jgi:hypothetical protein
MEATRKALAGVDGMWNGYAGRMMHPGYGLIHRWCDYLDFEDVVRIDRASIVAAATDPSRFAGAWRIVFGTGQLPKTFVKFGLVNTTHRYIEECERESGIIAPQPESLVFAEVFSEAVTRASFCDAIRRALILLRLSQAIKVDDAGHLV